MPFLQTHKHHCPFCGKPFDCRVPLCDDIPQMMCDGCWSEPSRLDELTARTKNALREAHAEASEFPF